MPIPYFARLYRYHRRETIEALTTEGVLWLGTLYGFRKMEGEMLADKEEGRLRLTEEILHYTANTPNAPLHRKAFGIPGPNQHFSQNTIIEHHETHDFWAYCTSRSLQSLAAVQKWHPAYDAVAVIEDTNRFVLLIANALEAQLHPLRSIGLWPIVYRSREYPNAQHDGTDPALIKPADFTSQDEARFTFDPMARPHSGLEAVRLHVPELVRCCRMLRDDELPSGRVATSGSA
jgi:hypothetical protein